MSRIYIVMYHYVRDLQHSRFPEIKGLNQHLFIEQIQFLKHNFNIMRMEDVIASYTSGYHLPENSVLLTFDDGYIDHYLNVFPILMKEKIQGSFFIPGKTFTEHKLLDVNKLHFILASSDINALVNDVFNQLNYYRGEAFDLPSNQELFQTYAQANRFDSKEIIFIKRLLQTVLPERLRNMITSNLFEKYIGVSEEKFAYELYMNYDQILCMKNAGMYIGLHGYDHYWLGNLNKQNMQSDISKALDVMSDFLNRDSWVMNFPYGSYNDEVIQTLKEKGCKLALTTEVRVADSQQDNPFKLPRLDTNDFPPKSEKYIEIAKAQ